MFASHWRLIASDILTLKKDVPSGALEREIGEKVMGIWQSWFFALNSYHSMAQDLPKAYSATEVEAGMYAAWEASGVFNPDRLPDRNQDGEPFVIMMPPPNVTGVLHLGHALENALMDTMVRFERMRGKKALLVPGTDHAAVATQARVEKTLMEKGMKNPRQELGREGLLKEIRAFAEDSQRTILGQVKKMGTSCDWSRLAFTFDDARSRAVNELFCSMYRDGLIYRGHRVVNWSVSIINPSTLANIFAL
jgi:valyl-tRNA synthetase